MVTKVQQRTIETPQGPITYTFERKKVKNRNLRIRPDGSVLVSGPVNSSAQQADQFVCSKSQWIIRALGRISAPQTELIGPDCSRAQSEAILVQAVQDVYPLVAGYGVSMPEVKVRRMCSQWGNCHWRQGYITMNLFLARCPEDLRQYVALHELVHFLQPNHGPAFYAYMDQLMPGWKGKRTRLKQLGYMLSANDSA